MALQAPTSASGAISRSSAVPQGLVVQQGQPAVMPPMIHARAGQPVMMGPHGQPQLSVAQVMAPRTAPVAGQPAMMPAHQVQAQQQQSTIADVYQQTMAGLTSKAANDARVASLVAKAVQHEKAGQSMAAVTCYHQALELDATDFHTLMSFARLKHRIGDLDGAIITYESVLKLHPDNAMVLNDLALCKARKGDHQNAAELLQAAVANKPSSKRYRNNLATVLMQMDDVQGAIDAITPTSGEAIARLFVAHLLQSKRQPEAAVDQLTEALRLDPSLVAARTLLANIQLPERQLANQMLHVPGKVVAPVRSAQAPSRGSQIRLQSAELSEQPVSKVFHADHYEIIKSIKE